MIFPAGDAWALAGAVVRCHGAGVEKGADQAGIVSRRGLIAGAAAAGLAGCGRGRDPDALTFWATGYEGDYAPLLMPRFTAETGIAVEHQSVPGTAAHEKYLTAHAGGSLPDVLMLSSGWVSEFAMIGAIRPVPDPALVSDTFPGVLDILRYRGVPHAVPWSVGPQVQFYRRDLVHAVGYDAPPEDWEGWRAMAWKVKRRWPDRYAVLMLLNWWDTLFNFAGQAGAYPLRDRDTRGNFQTPGFARALSFYVSLFRDGLAPAVASTEVPDPVAAFAQGDFTLYPSGPSLFTDLRRRYVEIPAERWGTARMPGPDGPGQAAGINNSLTVSATSKRPADAWALVRHLTSTPSELKFQRLIGVLPARASAWGDPQLADPVLRPFADQLRYPGPAPAIVEWERVRTEVQLVAERVVRGGLSEPEGLAEMDRRCDRLLAKRRELVEAGRIA